MAIESSVVLWFGAIVLNWLFLIQGIAYSDEEKDKHEMLGWFLMIFFAFMGVPINDNLGYTGAIQYLIFGAGFVLLIVAVTRLIAIAQRD